MATGFTVRLTEEAEEDLNGILHYCLTNSGHEATVNTHAKILEKLDEVAKMPTRFPPFELEGVLLKRVYRFTIAKKMYRVIYTIIEERDTVRVVSFSHVKRQLSTVGARLEEE